MLKEPISSVIQSKTETNYWDCIFVGNKYILMYN